MQPGQVCWVLHGCATFAALFGALTVKAGGNALFGDGAAGGNYAPLVIWLNFLDGFAYIAAAIGLSFEQRWAAWLALCLAGLTVVASGAFGVYVASGGAFEARTLWAMMARSVTWIGIALLAWWALRIGRREASGPMQGTNGNAIRHE